MYNQRVKKNYQRHSVDTGNIDKDKLTFVSPDELIINDEQIAVNDQILKNVAKDIISIQNPTKKREMMFQLKISNPNLELIDFVRQYIGINDIEGVNHIAIAQQAQHDWDWWKKKVAAPLKKAASKAGDWIKDKGDKIVGGIAKAAKVVGGVVSVIPGIGTAVGAAMVAGGVALDKVADKMEVAKNAIATVDAILPEKDNKTATKIVEAAARDGQVDTGKIAQTVDQLVMNNQVSAEQAATLTKSLTDVANATVSAKKESEQILANDVAKVNTASMGTSASNAKTMQLVLLGGLALFLFLNKK